jgi:hypothetical protein
MAYGVRRLSIRLLFENGPMPIYPPPGHEDVIALFGSALAGDVAEAAVYRICRDWVEANPSWSVLWSVAVPGGAQGREIDFIAVHPRLGVAVFEVKAPPLIPTATGWKVATGSSRRRYRRERPERQVQAATNALKHWWQSVGKRPPPRIAQFLVLLGTPAEALVRREAIGCLSPGCRIRLRRRGRDFLLLQRRKAYVVPRDLVGALPAVVEGVLRDAVSARRDNGAERGFFELAVPWLVPQAGARPASDDDEEEEFADRPRHPLWKGVAAMLAVGLVGWSMLGWAAESHRPAKKAHRPPPAHACVDDPTGLLGGEPLALAEKLCRGVSGLLRD